jgi:uncharacterized phage protein gp47/JayE
MSTTRGFSEIVNSMIERLKISQPNLDTKPGTVSRDLFIDLTADQISKFYNLLNVVSQKQSLATSSGQDLDYLASNFGIARSTGSPASGYIVVCINTLTYDIPIPTGTTVTARNGFVYKVLGNYSLSVSDKGRLSANANRLRKSLNIAGISANYAIEIPVECSRVGESGNISSLQVVTIDLEANGLTVTNLSSFAGGTSREQDDSFRSRILSIFSGANIGTSASYRNVALSVNGVQDALVVEPGSSLMLRDGTETISVSDNSTRIINSGTGGKVDIYVLGNKTSQVSESYIYTDLSGKGDATRAENDFVLGQSDQDLTRTINERRVLALNGGNIPLQPVSSMVSIVGSLSGELVESYTDGSGNVLGNYELVKDDSPDVGGSPFGFDKIHFISNEKAVTGEAITKGKNNSIDSVLFTGINNLNSVYSDVVETNDIATISKSSKSIIKLNHYPVLRVSRVQNVTTGEVYLVSNQNIDTTSGLNLTGEVYISGKQLPSPSDVVIVNYIWRKYFNEAIDYAGLKNISTFSYSSSQDAIDWTSPNGIIGEESSVELSLDASEYIVNAANNISAISSVYTDTRISTVVEQFVIDGETLYGVNIGSEITNVVRVFRSSDGLELFNTTKSDGKITGYKIILPSDSLAAIGDSVEVSYNKVELYNFDESDASYANSTITLPGQSVREANDLESIITILYTNNLPVYIDYVADINQLVSQVDLSKLPILSISGSNELTLSTDTANTTRQPMDIEFTSGIQTDTIRYSPTQLRLIAANIVNPGKFRVQGVSFNTYVLEVQGKDTSGRVIDITNALKGILGTVSTSQYGIARVNKVELKSGSTKTSLDVHGYSLYSNVYDKKRCAIDTSLSTLSFSTSTLSSNPSSFNSGDTIYVTCQVYNLLAQEEVSFRSSGTKITNNSYGIINKISISSGFKSTAGILKGTLEVLTFTQPVNSTSYYCDYDFTAPKDGERLTINYNINNLVIDVTNALEKYRPITADVLVKEAFSISVSVSGTILVNEDFLSEADTIEQNVITAISGILNTGSLGSRIDYSDIIYSAASVRGVDSVNISLFNEEGKVGRKAFISALENQTIVPGIITITAVSKDKFRIN